MEVRVSEDERFAALVGIDWADQKHDVLVLDTKTGQTEKLVIEQSPEALLEWMSSLEERYEGQCVAICLEQARGALIHLLMAHAFITLFPINPQMLSKFRKAMYPSGAKDDPKDARLLLEILQKHRDRIRAWKPDDELTRKLALLVEARRQAVADRTRMTNRLRALLKGYFPQALAWVGDRLYAPMAFDFLLKWPTLEAVQSASDRAIRAFYYGHHCRQEDLIKARLEQIRTTRPLTTDGAILKSSVVAVRMLASQLRVLFHSISEYDEEIAQAFAEHPDCDIFKSLPGAGPQLGPRLLAAFGTDRERFPKCEDLQSYSGIAPVIEASGKSSWTHWRWSCPKFLRQTFVEFAAHSIGFCAWARAYYQLQRSHNKSHNAAVRSLAFKWMRILYRCWKDRVPYDDARYMKSLELRGSPIFAMASHVASAK